jgi:GST-like protein
MKIHHTAIIDPTIDPSDPLVVFESGSILLYLSEKYEELMPIDAKERVQCMNWLFWASTGFSGQCKLFG